MQINNDGVPETRLELMLPKEVRERLAQAPVVYIPLGTVEWHGEHLPLGLDALTAHGICRKVAERAGGLVYPALHFGTGGGHGAYPFTVMMEGPAEIEALVTRTLARLNDFGVRQALLFSGHFPDEQLDMIDRIAANWNRRGTMLSVKSSAVSRIPGLAYGPDHAAIFETTLLYALHPDLVRVERLPAREAGWTEEDPFGTQRHDPDHPLWGIFGPDPRDFDPSQCTPLLEGIVAHLTKLMWAG
jgi:creatinine amidohydrolase